MSGITSHVLDTSGGKPAEGIKIILELNRGDLTSPKWEPVGDGTTNEDGRCPGLTGEQIHEGHYRISFLVDDYFKKQNVIAFYPVVRINFNVANTDQHYHVPLLLNPFGYSTYRGS